MIALKIETGAVPTENLPLKSHETKPSIRSVLERQQEAGTRGEKRNV